MTPDSRSEVLCAGIVVADAIASPVDEVPEPGRLALVDSVELHTGGCALSTASALARLGVPTALSGCVGDDLFGGVLARQSVYEAIENASSEDAIALAHGYTYSAHPLACAAALATLDCYRDEKLFDRVKALEPVWEEAVHGLRDCPNVIDIRSIGLIAGIELAPRPGAPGKRAYDAFRHCFEAGTLIRVTGDIEVAQDALQDGILRAVRVWPQGGVPDNPRAWVTVAARRCAIDRSRSENA